MYIHQKSHLHSHCVNYSSIGQDTCTYMGVSVHNYVQELILHMQHIHACMYTAYVLVRTDRLTSMIISILILYITKASTTMYNFAWVTLILPMKVYKSGVVGLEELNSCHQRLLM